MTDDSAALVQRARLGDAIALKLLLAATRQRLAEYINRRIPDALRRLIDADDIVQDTHVEVFRRIGEFTPLGEDSFFRWLATIGFRRLRNVVKWHRADKRGGGALPLTQQVEDSMVALLDQVSASGRTPSRSIARRESIAAVRTALQALPEHYRAALWLVYLEGRPVAEAAERLNTTDRAIHGLCRRGLKMLGDMLDASRLS